MLQAIIEKKARDAVADRFEELVATERTLVAQSMVPTDDRIFEVAMELTKLLPGKYIQRVKLLRVAFNLPLNIAKHLNDAARVILRDSLILADLTPEAQVIYTEMIQNPRVKALIPQD